MFPRRSEPIIPTRPVESQSRPTLRGGRPSPGMARRRAAVLALVALLVVPGSSQASIATPDDRPGAVHTRLEEASPAPDSVALPPVRELRLRFSTEVQLGLSSVELTDGAGTPVPSGPLAHGVGSGNRVLVLPLESPLPPGRYQVRWITAGPDGHPLQGSYGFSVGVAADARTGAVPKEDPVATGPDTDGPATDAPGGASPQGPSGGGPLSRPLPTGVRWVFYLTFVGMAGSVAFRALVVPAMGAPDLDPGVRRSSGGRALVVGAVSAGLALALAPARLAVRVQAFSQGPVGVDAGAILATPWGTGWLFAVGGALVGLGGALVARGTARERGGWIGLTVGALLVAIALPLSGHAWAEDPRGPAVASDLLHLLAAGAWLGGMGCMLFVGLPTLRAGAREDGTIPGLGELVGAFSRLALVAVPLLVASGIANAWLRLGSVGELWTTPWGLTLLLKLALVVPALLLGLYNWRVVGPALREDPRARLVVLPATVEWILGCAVLLVTAVLVVQAFGS